MGDEGCDEAFTTHEVSYVDIEREEGEVWCMPDPRVKELAWMWLYAAPEGSSIADASEKFGHGVEETKGINSGAVLRELERGCCQLVMLPGPPKKGIPRGISTDWDEAGAWFYGNQLGPSSLETCMGCGVSVPFCHLYTHCVYFDVKVCRACDLRLRNNRFSAACIVCGSKDGRDAFMCQNARLRKGCRTELCRACHSKFQFRGGLCHFCVRPSAQEWNANVGTPDMNGVTFVGFHRSAQQFHDVAPFCPQGYPVLDSDALNLLSLSRARLASALKANLFELAKLEKLFTEGRLLYKRVEVADAVTRSLTEEDITRCNACRHVQDAPDDNCFTPSRAFLSKCLFQKVDAVTNLKTEFHLWVVVGLGAKDRISLQSDVSALLVRSVDSQLVDLLGLPSSNLMPKSYVANVLRQIWLFHALNSGRERIAPKRITPEARQIRREAASYAESQGMDIPLDLSLPTRKRHAGWRGPSRNAQPAGSLKSATGGASKRSKQGPPVTEQPVVIWDSTKLGKFITGSRVLLREFASEEREAVARTVGTRHLGGACLVTDAADGFFEGSAVPIWCQLKSLRDPSAFEIIVSAEVGAGAKF